MFLLPPANPACLKIEPMPFVYILLMFLAPLASGLLLGFIQLAFYRIIRRPAETTPSFPILFARGLLLFFLIAAILALVLRFAVSGDY